MGVQQESALRFEAPSDAAARAIRASLSAWFASEKRDLPWRRTRDAYAIWVSEAMLQQTRVEVVKDYWPRFLERFPTARALAAAEEEAVLEAWSGLGYYRRARSLQAAARVIAAEYDGEFPRALAAALSLPGVGPYTAGAVVSIAYGEPAPLVDGNVERVFARLFGLDGVRTSGPLMRACWDAARFFIERDADGVAPGDWNQALMELGALVCTSKSPSCGVCPLAERCVARAGGTAAEIPRPKPRRAVTEVSLEIYVVERDGLWLLEQRPLDGLMGGLWEFPTVETTGTGLFPELLAGPLESGLEPEDELLAITHTITHHRIRARVRAARFGRKSSEDDCSGGPRPLVWVAPSGVSELALTGMGRKVAKRLAP